MSYCVPLMIKLSYTHIKITMYITFYFNFLTPFALYNKEKTQKSPMHIIIMDIITAEILVIRSNCFSMP